MRVLLSGSTGLVGTALLGSLQRQKYDVVRLVRPSTRGNSAPRARMPEPASLAWDPGAGHLDSAASDADAVVHLAGASIADGRWTPARKNILRESRVAATRHLVDSLARLAKPPRIFIAASAVGFYGDRADEALTESSSSGLDFLADLCRGWEAESNHAAEFGARVVILRFGIILARHGGALPRMVFPFRLGVGGRLGSGRQWMSWIALEDAVGMIEFALNKDSVSGPINAVSPEPVRNSDFTRTLGRVLRRPALFPVPGFALRLALGEMAGALLLSSQRVLPEKALKSGYPLSHQSLQQTLSAVLGGQ
jgi:uncharacterized protein (TIGR01777 family)